MSYLSIDELFDRVKGRMSIATLNRRLLTLKKNDKKAYESLTQKDGRNKLYKEVETLAYLVSEKPKKYRKKRVVKHKPKRPKKKIDKGDVTHLNASEELEIKLEFNDEEYAQYKALKGDILGQHRFEKAVMICRDYAEGFYTQHQACLLHDTMPRTFREWHLKYPYIAALYKKCLKQRDENRTAILKEEAVINLRRLLNGEQWKEITQTFHEVVDESGETVLIPKDRKVTQKRTMPNMGAVAYALNNTDPENWKNRSAHDVTAKAITDIDRLDEMTDEQLMTIIKQGMEKGLLNNNNSNQND